MERGGAVVCGCSADAANLEARQVISLGVSSLSGAALDAGRTGDHLKGSFDAPVCGGIPDGGVDAGCH